MSEEREIHQNEQFKVTEVKSVEVIYQASFYVREK